MSLANIKGYWSALTNIPHLANGTGTPGDIYLISEGGVQDLGSGSFSYGKDYSVVYLSTNVWIQEKIQYTLDFADVGGGSGGGSVTSVGVLSTDLSVSGSPITTSGDITLNINTHAVTYTKMQQASAAILLGNPTGSTADLQEITLGAGLSFSGSTLIATGSGLGTVTNFSSGNLAPLFTTSVATSTTTPALSFVPSNVAAHTYYGNNTSGSTTPSFNSLILASGDFSNQGTTTTVLHGNTSGSPSWAQVSGSDIVTSVALAGSPTTTTQPPGDNSTRIATTAYVNLATSGSVTSVSNTNGTLTIAPTIGSVIASLNLGSVNSWQAGQSGQPVTLTDGTDISINLSSANNFFVTLAGNRTLDVPSNIATGQSGVINVTQDGTGSRTLSYGWVWNFPGGSVPAVSSGKYITDKLIYYVDYYFTHTVTISNASPAVLTWTAHGLTSGQLSQLTTTGTLPTGLSTGTNYYINVIDANTFNLSTSFANLQAGTFINTSSAGSGTHTITVCNIYAYLNNSTSPVNSISGTANRITVTGTVNPSIDIAATYVGQTSITTLGIIATATWNANKIGLAYGGTNADLSATGGAANYLKQASTGATITVGTIPASDIGSGAALTKTDDTNVTLTLGGTPATSLLAATSLTLGWTGQLALTRGGTAASLTASNGGIVYSTASAMAILSGTATASKMLLSGSSTAPTWSTSTIPTSAGSTANKVLLSDGTNYALSTPTFPNASATTRKIIVSDGTNWVASTETYAVPGTSGHVLTSDGTNWTSSALSFTGLVEMIAGNDINSSIGNNTYTLILYAEYGLTINELKIMSTSGTCTAAVKINGTSVTGISAVSVSSTIATGTASAANTVSSGNSITLVLSSTSSLINLQWTIKTTRT